VRIQDLLIEVTRKCQLNCDHCLRGGKQNVNIKPEYIRAILKDVDAIGTVVFTGGEPSLNIDAMKEFINICKEKDIWVDNFHIVTNGVIHKKYNEFMTVLLDLFLLCKSDQSDMPNCVSISNTMFHEQAIWGLDKEPIPFNEHPLSAFRFTEQRRKFERGDYLVNQGRAKKVSWDKFREESPDTFDIEFSDSLEVESIGEGYFYLNALGYIIPGCDFSYVDQKNNQIAHCLDNDWMGKFISWCDEQQREEDTNEEEETNIAENFYPLENNI